MKNKNRKINEIIILTLLILFDFFMALYLVPNSAEIKFKSWFTTGSKSKDYQIQLSCYEEPTLNDTPWTEIRYKVFLGEKQQKICDIYIYKHSKMNDLLQEEYCPIWTENYVTLYDFYSSDEGVYSLRVFDEDYD